MMHFTVNWKNQMMGLQLLQTILDEACFAVRLFWNQLLLATFKLTVAVKQLRQLAVKIHLVIYKHQLLLQESLQYLL